MSVRGPGRALSESGFINRRSASRRPSQNAATFGLTHQRRHKVPSGDNAGGPPPSARPAGTAGLECSPARGVRHARAAMTAATTARAPTAILARVTLKNPASAGSGQQRRNVSVAGVASKTGIPPRQRDGGWTALVMLRSCRGPGVGRPPIGAAISPFLPAEACGRILERVSLPAALFDRMRGSRRCRDQNCGADLLIERDENSGGASRVGAYVGFDGIGLDANGRECTQCARTLTPPASGSRTR